MPKSLRILSGGPAQSLVKQLQDRFAAEDGFAIRGTFGATGAMQEKLVAGEPCDVIILPKAAVEELAAGGHVARGTEKPLGAVHTGIAVKTGEPKPDVSTPEALKAALRAARGIYIPDPLKATAGIHFMQVVKELGLEDELASRLHPFPNGAAAMRALAQFPEPGQIGWTHVTQILYTPGVELAGLVAHELDPDTVYTAAVCARAQEPAAAAHFIRLLTSSETAGLRTASGFETL